VYLSKTRLLDNEPILRQAQDQNEESNP